jgi:hypothetical protein
MKANCPETDWLPHTEANVSDDGRMINVFELSSIGVPFLKGDTEGGSAGGGVDNVPQTHD